MRQIICSLVLCLSAVGAFALNPPTTAVKPALTASGASVALSCTPATQPPGITVQSFNFYRSTTNGSGYTLIGSSATCGSTQSPAFTDTTVQPATTYYYVAQASTLGVGTACAGQTCSGFSPQATAVIPASYTIGGTVSGLSGTGLVLQDNGADNLTVTANGSFTFAVPIISGQPYAVTVLTSPTNPPQTCTVSSGTGTATANVTNVSIACVTNPPTPPTGLTVTVIP